MKLLLTGASGFLGSQMKPILSQEYDVTSLGKRSDNDIQCDLAKGEPVINVRYDVVVHAAGKAHVIPRSSEEIAAFYDVNYQGTVNLCKALENAGCPKSIVYISTVAVYGCDSGEGVIEDHPLNGVTPYAKSKIQAEGYLEEWCDAHGVILTILRPSLIAGPNPPGNLGSMIKGIEGGRYVSIDGGKARKSVVMAEDVAKFALLAVLKGGVYNVCDDDNPSFHELEMVICKHLGKSLPVNIPMWMARCLAWTGDIIGRRFPFNSNRLAKMTQSLTFSNEKAKRELDWRPMSVLEFFRIR